MSTQCTYNELFMIKLFFNRVHLTWTGGAPAPPPPRGGGAGGGGGGGGEACGFVGIRGIVSNPVLV
jgi:hypothetical protein